LRIFEPLEPPAKAWQLDVAALINGRAGLMADLPIDYIKYPSGK
jgi:hypothetical protein